MNPKTVALVLAALALAGCKMTDDEIRQKTGDAAVAIKHAADKAGESMKGAYDEAAAKGKEAMGEAGEKLSDVALKGKVLAGFNLVAGLEAKDIEVEVKDKKVYLKGTVPTQMDKMKAEGVAYGVTGDTSKFVSTIEVRQP